jgi:hypothetical protein
MTTYIFTDDQGHYLGKAPATNLPDNSDDRTETVVLTQDQIRGMGEKERSNYDRK